MKGKLKKITLHKSVDNTVKDVIKQLNKLHGDDRCSLLLEHMETLIFEWEELEVLWLNYKEGETNGN